MDKNAKSSLNFKGVLLNHHEIIVKSKPRFSDALRILKHPSKNNFYQTIPLSETQFVAIYYQNRRFQFTYQNQSFLLFEGNQQLSEDAVYNIVNNFIVKEGNKVSYLTNFPEDKIRPAKRKKGRVLAVSKRVDE
ncbi:hypothetical protein BIV60_20625 [Bacillus sp. MUM 116]|uniref:hypothetical protein n=1 Tax=Bacillus sp. MUM 116 TaxID=1678002 RepID=UPI0008F5E87E|nr:hypothetical protein [Bacillus sp. MUM 116]OIK10627.1 hypothetical protein BIV60_20625 [Bacillus sp. MUM 116]